MVRCTVRGKTAKKNEMKSFNTEKKEIKQANIIII